MSSTPSLSDLARFFNKVVIQDDDCWVWIGAKSRGKGNTKWYGTFHFQGKSIRAHRFSCDVLAGNELPEGYDRDHTCTNSLCVNPNHLQVVTKLKNQQLKAERAKKAVASQ